MARFQKGQSGNPGGRPKTVALVRNGCSKLLPRSLARLALLLESEDEKVALAAVKEVNDRAVGRASVALEVEIAELAKIKADTAVALAKLKLLEAGHDPDQPLTIIIPETLRRDDG